MTQTEEPYTLGILGRALNLCLSCTVGPIHQADPSAEACSASNDGREGPHGLCPDWLREDCCLSVPSHLQHTQYWSSSTTTSSSTFLSFLGTYTVHNNGQYDILFCKNVCVQTTPCKGAHMSRCTLGNTRELRCSL